MRSRKVGEVGEMAAGIAEEELSTDSERASFAAFLRQAKRLVIKVGTSTLTYKTGRFNLARMEHLVRQVVDLANEGREVVFVTSGAIGAGMSRLGLSTRPSTIPETQGVAAVGQGLLMQMYEKLFSEYGRVVGQLLLTRDDLTDRKRHLNCRNTVHSLWRMGVVPIVNENDTVAVDELKFGDNDTLAALVASLVGADLLIILSDVEGLYDRNPQIDPEAALIPVVHSITPQLMEQAGGGPGSAFGVGGMSTKIQAARIATAAGIGTVVANGARRGVLRKVLRGEEVGTFFVPAKERLGGKKRWIAFHHLPHGKIVVDPGAAKALVKQGSSLLPAGILAVKGRFTEGDMVQVISEDGLELARGLVNYSSDDLEKIAGCTTHEIENRLGYKYYDEAIHRDNLVVSP